MKFIDNFENAGKYVEYIMFKADDFQDFFMVKCAYMILHILLGWADTEFCEFIGASVKLSERL